MQDFQDYCMVSVFGKLAKKFKDIDNFFTLTIDDLLALDDFGEITAKSVIDFFSLPQARDLIDKFKSFGVITVYNGIDNVSNKFEGMTFVLTGTLPTMTRDKASEIITLNGGKVSGSVSKKTTYVLAGEEAGSKLTKAKSLGINIIDEKTFMEMVEK